MKRRLTEDGMLVSSFSERVVEIARAIPKGKVMTYGDIARAAGGGQMASQSTTAILGVFGYLFFLYVVVHYIGVFLSLWE